MNLLISQKQTCLLTNIFSNIANKFSHMRAVGQINGHEIFAIEETESLPINLFNSGVSAGFPSPALDYMQEEIDLVKLFNLNSPSVYIIRVNGDSMQDAHILNKSLIAVDRKIKPQNRHLVVVVLNQEFTIKRILKTAAGWMLHPENPVYKPYVVKSHDEFEVWGVVTQIFINPNLCL